MKKNDLVIVCVHVKAKTRDAEYNEEDDTYICSLCRDVQETKGWEFIKDDLSTLCRGCLGV